MTCRAERLFGGASVRAAGRGGVRAGSSGLDDARRLAGWEGCRKAVAKARRSVSDDTQSKREILPIPDVAPAGLTTYDAKDPDTAFPPIVALRPPDGAPECVGRSGRR